jgi:glutathione synthase
MKIAIIMDPIEQLAVKKDSSVALMRAAAARHIENYYIVPDDIMLKEGQVQAVARQVHFETSAKTWFSLSEPAVIALTEFDAVFMRLDPPFNLRYVYLTQLLSLAVRDGARVVNNPDSIRDCNEKLFSSWFPDCCPPTLVTSQMAALDDFLDEQQEIIVKPLDGMGGRSIFYVKQGDLNKKVIFETITQHDSTLMMAQRFIPEVRLGDKRITLINGEPVSHAVLRVPHAEDVRANLAAGGRAHIVPLSARDQTLCQRIGPTLKEKGLLWVGLDVIGDYVTEINVTSPTCIRELEEFNGQGSRSILDPLLAAL